MKKAFVTKVVPLFVFLGLIIVIFLAMGERSVKVVLSQQEQIGVAGPVRLNFSQPMDEPSVEERIHIEPDVEIGFRWIENTLLIWPEIPFAAGNYQLVLEPGSRAKNNGLIESPLTWSFSIRKPELVFLYPANGSSDLWKTDLMSDAITQITKADGKVYDYAVSKDGEMIVFSVTNAVGGKDLWVTDRDGVASNKLVDCGRDDCFEPTVSPDRSKIAYSRIAQAGEMSKMGSKIWLFDLSNKKSALLVDDPTINGTAGAWSPKGDYLAFVDEANGLIRIFDLANKEITNLPSSGLEVGVWSPNGKKMIIPSTHQVGVQVFSGLSLVDFDAEVIEPLFTQTSNIVDYFAPDYAPQGDQIILGRREQLINGRSSIQIWLVNLATKKLDPITTNQNFSHGGFHWSPGGKQVVYQRFSLGSSKATPEIYFWDLDTQISTLIVENAAIPQWLP